MAQVASTVIPSTHQAQRYTDTDHRTCSANTRACALFPSQYQNRHKQKYQITYQMMKRWLDALESHDDEIDAESKRNSSSNLKSLLKKQKTQRQPHHRKHNTLTAYIIQHSPLMYYKRCPLSIFQAITTPQTLKNVF